MIYFQISLNYSAALDAQSLRKIRRQTLKLFSRLNRSCYGDVSLQGKTCDMPVTIGSNIASLQAQRQLFKIDKSLSTTFERLSSGQRINRASDDAAGLAISEKLRADSRLSSQAIRNVNDGISMISIISGALDTQKDILFRMAELAEQSANGTYSSTQRDALQQEYLSLQEEFDRVASSSTFNGLSLLRNPEGATIQLMTGITGADEALLTVTAANSHRFSGKIAMQSDADEDGLVGTLDLGIIGAQVNSSNELSPGLPFLSRIAEVTARTDTGKEVRVAISISRIGADFFSFVPSAQTEGPPAFLTLLANATHSTGEQSAFNDNAFPASGLNSTTLDFTFAGAGETASVTLDLSGFEYDWYQGIEGEAEIAESNIGFTHVRTASAARIAIDTVQNRINDLSALQGEYGAMESRLKVAGNQLQVNRENFDAAASRITDTDVAEESAKLINLNVLQQAATAVLTQANQQPALALQLLAS